MANRLYKLFIVLFLVCFSLNVYALEDEVVNETTEIKELEEEKETSSEETSEEVYTTGEDVISSRYKLIIEDDANLLSEVQKDQLYSDMTPLTEYGHIMFKSINSNYTSTSSYAEKYYHEKVGTDSGTLFLIDMDNRQIYIFSDGSNYNIVTIDKANIITDNVYRYASNGNYYECASEAYKQILTILGGNKIAEPMRYISNGLIAITAAAFINFFIVMRKSKLRRSDDKEILKECKVNFQIGEITGHKTGTKRVYSPPSDSGGSSGGGGGGGGGSSGGGGGHGF